MTMRKEMALRCRQVPFVATIMGECFAGPSWLAALADFVVQVKGSCMAVSGPRVPKVATSEVVENEDLGGWKLHAEITGQADRVAEDEAGCFRIVREFLCICLPMRWNCLPSYCRKEMTRKQGKNAYYLSFPRKLAAAMT